ncbi:hypothetical protein S7335_3437 [Synechococcus sp. PCC 7335]|nr:hypothetical protein S7335_3437 [Synechococcus sp. PCC 7335]
MTRVSRTLISTQFELAICFSSLVEDMMGEYLILCLCIKGQLTDVAFWADRQL